MLLLTIETCTETSTLGLVRDGAVLAEAAFPSRYTLAKQFYTRLDWLLAETELAKTALEGVAVSQGPGSFTGVRIGMAAAKALASWLNIPIAAVPTLEALAYLFRELPDTWLVPLVNARRQQAYMALFRGRERRTPDLLLSVDPFHALLREHIGSEAVCFIGQTEGLPSAFREGLPGRHATVRSLVTPHALAALAEERLARGAGDDPLTLTPIYLRGAAD